MAARRTSLRVPSDSCRVKSVLASAVLEWLLILLLLLDAIFSYLVTKFANFCELQVPCLFCSRLDHILGSEKPGFYRDLICHAHKLEFSSLVCCRTHEKLADACGMCEGCLFSLLNEKKSSSGTYRTLVGKLGAELECCVDGDHHIDDCHRLQHNSEGVDQVKDPLLKVPASDAELPRHCSCCTKPLKTKTYTQKLLHTNSIDAEVAELDDPLLVPKEHSRPHRQDGLKKRREKSAGLTSVSFLGSHGSDTKDSFQKKDLGSRSFDPLAHIGYTELKITSDTESEVLISDDDEVSSQVHENSSLKEEVIAQYQSVTIMPNALPKTLSVDLELEKLIHQTPVLKPSLPISPDLDVNECQDVLPSVPDVATSHGLEELNWHQVEEVCKSPAHGLSSSANATKAPPEVYEKKIGIKGTGDVAHESGIKNKEVIEPEGGLTSIKSVWKVNETTADPGLSVPNFMDINDAYKLAVGDRVSHPMESSAELLNTKESSKIHEDLKLLLSQISAARGFDLSWNDMSPRVPIHGDDLKTSETASPIDLQMLQKRFSIERNESGLESLDGSIVSEIEGESAAERLKRQMELDRKFMRALHKELEEERNASAIAANQAMAMITRLQEEKAAMQMEALQYQRMMEEQAEYDQEALQKSNDLLAEREKEIQDLEAEIETYKKKLQNESVEDHILGSSSYGMTSDSHELNSEFPSNTTLIRKSRGKKDSERNNVLYRNHEGNKTLEESLLDLKDEKLYISKCLKRLEKRLHLFSNNRVYVDISGPDVNMDGFPGKICDGVLPHGSNEEPAWTVLEDNVAGNGGSSPKEVLEVNHQEQHHCNEISEANNQIGGEVFSMHKDSSQSKRAMHAKARYNSSSEDKELNTKDNHEDALSSSSDNDMNSSKDFSGEHLAAIECEVSLLNERLVILEEDRNFLEHTINSLRNGIEGMQFIQEIAAHLRELRRIAIRRDQAVA